MHQPILIINYFIVVILSFSIQIILNFYYLIIIIRGIARATFINDNIDMLLSMNYYHPNVKYFSIDSDIYFLSIAVK